MPRPRSDAVLLVRRKLLARLEDGLHRPGDRFLSARAVAEQFGVSYQTADRLLRELSASGFLERRAASGTFVAGSSPPLTGVDLHFATRANRPGSFGDRLIRVLRLRLARAGIPVALRPGPTSHARPGRLPVVWELPVPPTGAALLLNDRPASADALRVDSIGVDDFLGGVLAGQIVARQSPPPVAGTSAVAVLAGPEHDRRSRQRIAGFLSVRPATVVHAPSWFAADAADAADRLLQAHPSAVFACNDRLAEAVLRACDRASRPTPVLVGFDDAPIAERLHLTTIAIPWDALANAVLSVARRRLMGDRSAASHLMLAPRPVIRLT